MTSMQLDQVEFELLKGTEVMINMIKNRKQVVGISNDLFEDLLDYLDANAEKLFYVRSLSEKRISIYFESPIDKENVTQVLRQFSNDDE